MKRLILMACTMVLAGLVSTQSVHGQSKSGTSAAKADKYKEARDHIRKARTLLSDFVTENPGGADGYFARLQLAALEDIFKTDVPVVPVKLNEHIQWRIVRVETSEDRTKISVEIENPDTESHHFPALDMFPLVMMANKKPYAMKKTGIKRPAAVGVTQGYESRWILQPTQATIFDIYFDALDKGVLSGLVKFVGDSYELQAVPAQFSLMNVNQDSVTEE